MSSKHIANGDKRFDEALAALPRALAGDAAAFRERLRERHPDASFAAIGDAAGLARLVATSEYAATTLLADWDYLSGVIGAAAGSRESRSGTSATERIDTLAPAAEVADRVAFMRELRRYRHRGLFLVLWQEIALQGDVADSLSALSTLADRSIAAACRFAYARVAERFGDVRHADGASVPLIVAMGKLGGRELNVSSDVDLVFAYSEDGDSDGRRSLSAAEYFARVARETIALLEQQTPDGFVYRVDTRLRPFGLSGPPVVSLDALERYLAEHGRDWERYAWVKARPLDLGFDADANDRLVELVNPFVYRRYLDYGVFESLRDMHGLIESEVSKREMADNVKLGPGGIREVEFIVQSLQLVRGGSVPALRTPALEAAAVAAVDDRDWEQDDAETLLTAYRYLRRVENVLQGLRDRQTHELPLDDTERLRVATALGYPSWDAFTDSLAEQRGIVSERFAEIGVRDSRAHTADGRRARIGALWAARGDAGEWEALLSALGIAGSRDVARRLATFRADPALRRIDAVAARRLQHFMAGLIVALAEHAAPDLALERVLIVVDAVLRRTAYLALLNENAPALKRLIDLCGRSIYLTRQLQRYPVLLDELIDARVFEAPPSRAELAAELAAKLASASEDDEERRLEVLAEFQRTAMFRVAVADFSDALPIMKVSDRLTDIAELILEEVLALATASVVRQFGRPRGSLDDADREAAIGIIAYGKLAGFELSYSSDLDLVFIHDSAGDDAETTGPRTIGHSVFFSRLVRRLVHLLSTRTAAGVLYEIDTRLRPSGRSGLLVSGLDAFIRYQRDDAWTWEHQALLRSRAVAGSEHIRHRFERIRADVLTAGTDPAALADEVVSMRRRMRESLDRSDAQSIDLKQGRGGIVDIEFIVQYSVLLHAADDPRVIRYPDIIRQLEALAEGGFWTADNATRMMDCYRSLRAITHRLALDERAALAEAVSVADERAAVIEAWRATFGADPP